MAEELARQLISGLASPTKLIRDMSFIVLINLYENDEKLEAVREFVLGRREDIEKDIEDLGMLKPVLEYFLEG